MTRLHLLFECGADGRPHGSSYIRLIRPLTHPAAGPGFEVTWSADYRAADVVLVDRTWRKGATVGDAERLVAQLRRDGGRLLYSLDDNLLDLETDGLFVPGIAPEQKMLIRYLAREADGVLVSTAPLAERMRRLNPAVRVVPNALDERLFPAGPPAVAAEPRGTGGRLRVGYMGTPTHDADLYAVVEALRNVAPAIELELVGGFSDPRLPEALSPVPVRTLDPEGSVEYPAFAGWLREHARWDFAIAPLADGEFARCKSDIKFLDYGILGIPAICSDVEAYRAGVAHGETGWRAENTPEAWTAALETFVGDAALRRRLGAQAERHVRASRTLEHAAPRWTEALAAILGAPARR